MRLTEWTAFFIRQVSAVNISITNLATVQTFTSIMATFHGTVKAL